MASSVLKKAANNSVILHATSNSTFVVAGNNSVSNLAANDEIVTGATIKQVWTGSSSGNGAHWIVSRGSNVVCVFDSTCWIDYAGNGFAINKDAAANVVVNLVNSADDTAYIMLEVKKIIG